ncbi:hypothetical protein SAMN05443579_114150 [Variovorax sp. PDC80]|uniref:hypothetical protein n=1 Tax=Variovorax sp. PDC80 TaxID=1882827 RepID=UPI0008F2D9BF|nr:hypothetical protein [Variovorax sp. PDC80]SFP72681.1 hypothetical protein SAMN05443579_114150 [Variovorax sp. PDC80]
MARAEDRSGATWCGLAFAGALPGFALAIALSGLFAWLGPGGMAPLNKYQFNMWIVPPLWLGICSAAFMFRSALRAWAWLGGATAVAGAMLFAVRHLSG